MLIDTGPLVTLLDQADSYHAACHDVAKKLPAGPLWTTWPCFTEAMYLLGKSGGYQFQERLWQMRRNGALHFLELAENEIDRMAALMQRYRDVPLDLADASLIAIAECRNIRRLFSLDSDLYIYRLADGSTLEIIR